MATMDSSPEIPLSPPLGAISPPLPPPSSSPPAAISHPVLSFSPSFRAGTASQEPLYTDLLVVDSTATATALASAAKGPITTSSTALPPPPPPSQTRKYIDAQLTVNSLILLGFDSDEYLQVYSGIAYDLTPLTKDSLDSAEGEKMLLLILHYLFSILDADAFGRNIQSCWPFLDLKEKNAFKQALHKSCKRLIERGGLPQELYQPSYLNNAHSAHSWALLRRLTDLALDKILPSDRVERMKDYDVLPKDDLFRHLSSQVEVIGREVRSFHDEEQDCQKYLQELVDRLHRCQRALAKQGKDPSLSSMAPPSSPIADEMLSTGGSRRLNPQLNERTKRKLLGSRGQAVRNEKVAQLQRHQQLLNEFLDSPLLTEIAELIKSTSNLAINANGDNGSSGGGIGGGGGGVVGATPVREEKDVTNTAAAAALVAAAAATALAEKNKVRKTATPTPSVW